MLMKVLGLMEAVYQPVSPGVLFCGPLLLQLYFSDIVYRIQRTV